MKCEIESCCRSDSHSDYNDSNSNAAHLHGVFSDAPVFFVVLASSLRVFYDWVVGFAGFLDYFKCFGFQSFGQSDHLSDCAFQITDRIRIDHSRLIIQMLAQLFSC